MKCITNLALCVCMALLVSCGRQEPSEPQENLPLLKVGHVGHDHQLALYVAALEGSQLESKRSVFLKEVKKREIYDLIDHGKPIARLRLIKVGGGSRMPAAMERGEIDLGLGGVAAVAFFIDKGNDFKIVFPLQTDGDMLVMRQDFTADHWESFVQQVKAQPRALKIGYKAPVAVAKLIFERALKAEGVPIAKNPGMEEAKVELVNLQGAGNLIPTLANGAIDGFVVNQPYASMAVDKKVGKIVCDLSTLPPAGKWQKHPCCCVATTKTVLNKHRAIVKSFLNVLCAATASIHANQETAIQHAAAWTKNPLAVEQTSVPTVNYMSYPSPKWMEGMATWAAMMN
ncbi:hypothetical protein GF373_10225, partial [bacterium]|nr:hypothetical protein [bacterium]